MPAHQPQPSHTSRGYTAALFSAVFLSTTAIFIRYLTQYYQMPALLLAFWRDVFVALTLLVVLGLARPRLLHITTGHLKYLILYGLVLAFFNAFWTLSVAFNGAAVATVLVYCSAGFTALLGRWLLKEPLGWGKLVAVALSIGGCVLVSQALDATAWRGSLPGLLMGVSAGLMYAFYSLMGRSASQRGLNPWTSLIYAFTFAGIFLMFVNLLPANLLFGSSPEPVNFFWLGSGWAGWGVLFLLAAGPTIAGFGLYNVSLSYLPSSVTNLIVTLEPAFTAITAYLFFGERLNGIQLAGSLMILSGVVVMRLFEGWFERKSPRTAAGANPSQAD